MLRILLVLAIASLLTGCIPPLPSSSMLPSSRTYASIPAAPKLKDKIEIRNISVVDGVGGANAAVTKEQFAEALNTALLMSGLASRGANSGDFYLDAHVLKADQPFIGLNLTVTTYIEYTLSRKSNNEVVFHDTLVLPYTAKLTDAFDWRERLRVATARAISENITHLLKVLSSKAIS